MEVFEMSNFYVFNHRSKRDFIEMFFSFLEKSAWPNVVDAAICIEKIQGPVLTRKIREGKTNECVFRIAYEKIGLKNKQITTCVGKKIRKMKIGPCIQFSVFHKLELSHFIQY